jgi:hypothetical protein
MSTPSPNRPDRARKLQRQLEALELRRMGFSYVEIGARIGCSKSAAHRYVDEAMAEASEQVRGEANVIKAEEISRLDGMLRGLWPTARKGNHGAVDRVLKIMERRARLLGLDAPVKVAATNKEGDEDADPTRYIVPVPAGMEMDEWLRKFGPSAPQ